MSASLEITKTMLESLVKGKVVSVRINGIQMFDIEMVIEYGVAFLEIFNLNPTKAEAILKDTGATDWGNGRWRIMPTEGGIS